MGMVSVPGVRSCAIRKRDRVTAADTVIERFEPAAEVRRAVDSAFAAARTFVRDFDPQLVVLFGPDHYNGFFYDVMPPFNRRRREAGAGEAGTDRSPSRRRVHSSSPRPRCPPDRPGAGCGSSN